MADIRYLFEKEELRMGSMDKFVTRLDSSTFAKYFMGVLDIFGEFLDIKYKVIVNYAPKDHQYNSKVGKLEMSGEWIWNNRFSIYNLLLIQLKAEAIFGISSSVKGGSYCESA